MWTKWFLPLVNPALAALAALLFFSGGLLVAYKWVDSRAYHRGEQAERKVWEDRQKDVQIDALKVFAEEVKKAASVGQSIANTLAEAAVAKEKIITRTQTIVKEVQRENAALPNVDTCIMPDAVIRLRDEQVRSSKARETEALDYTRKRLNASRKLN